MPALPQSRPAAQEAVVALARGGVTLDLQTVDLCFAAALYLRSERSSTASFSEDQLVDVFEQVALLCEADPTSAEPLRRAGPCIRRLREQRMLARVDGAGVMRAGEYALTRLATGVVEFFLDDETLTRESLALLTHTLLVTLREVLKTARDASTADAWQTGVIGPLRVTVPELVGGIQRRQRGFDLRQEQLQHEISTLLQADWFAALERCQSLLDTMSATLRELNQVLLRDVHELQSVLGDLQQVAADARASDEADSVMRAVSDQADRVAAWGAARQHAWSEYYQYVHGFLRDVVRLDPTRLITQRLRERLAGRGGPGFALTVASAPPIRLLRPVQPPPVDRPPVRRRRADGDAILDEVPARNPLADIEAAVRVALSEGARQLGELTARLTGNLSADARFVTAGRIAAVVARVGAPSARAERPWVMVADGLTIEEWSFPTTR